MLSDEDDEELSVIEGEKFERLTLSPSVDLRDVCRSGNDEELYNVIRRLTFDGELQKLLSDEKMRGEVHKSNYEDLKLKFIKLLHESRFHVAELTKADEERKTLENALKMSKEENVKLVKEYEAQIEALLSQIPTEGQILALEHNVKSSNESAWSSKINETMNELEASKLTIHRLIQENLYLKHIHYHTTQDSERKAEEIALNFKGKIKELEKVNKNLMEEQRPTIASLEAEVIKLGKERSVLLEKIKFVEQNFRESEDERKNLEGRIRGLKSKSSEDLSDKLSKIAKLEAESHGLRKSLVSAEEESQRLKLETLGLRKEIDRSNGVISDLEDQGHSIRRSMEEEIEKIKLEFAKERTSLYCEKEFTSKRLKDSESECERLHAARTLFEQENGTLRRELDLQKTDNKTEMTKKLAEAEMINSEWQMKIKSIERMNSELKAEKERSDSEVIRSRDERELLLKDISVLSDENAFYRSELEALSGKNAYNVDQIHALENEISEFRRDDGGDTSKNFQKARTYGKLIKKLRSKLEDAEKESEDLRQKLEKAEALSVNEHHRCSSSLTAPSECISPEDETRWEEKYLRLRTKYEDLKTRHKEFSKLLKTGPN